MHSSSLHIFMIPHHCARQGLCVLLIQFKHLPCVLRCILGVLAQELPHSFRGRTLAEEEGESCQELPGFLRITHFGAVGRSENQVAFNRYLSENQLWCCKELSL